MEKKDVRREIMLAKVISCYEGKKQMLRMAAEEAKWHLPVDAEGNPITKDLDDWVQRMEERIQKTMANEIIRVHKMYESEEE